jgi:hypothetical protein
MPKKLKRRDLVKYAGMTSALSFFPYVSRSFAQGSRQKAPKIRAVVRLQMYGGWDVAMSIDPPRERHVKAGSQSSQSMMHWNFPSGIACNRNFLEENGPDKDVKQAKAQEERIKSVIGAEFFNNPKAALRVAKDGNPGMPLSDPKEFQPISGEVGLGESPFKVLDGEGEWTKVFEDNKSIALGPLAHFFLNIIDADPQGTQRTNKRYIDYMTIINGIDTDNNVSHDAGDVLAACGFMPQGVGNGFDIKALKFKPSIEHIFANELLRNPADLLPNGVSPAFVSGLTFSNPGMRRGYSYAGSNASQVDLFDTRSLTDLATITKTEFPEQLANSEKLVANLLAQTGANDRLKNLYGSFFETVKHGGLGLGEFSDAERNAFSGMIEILLEKSPTKLDDNVIPAVAFLQEVQGKMQSTTMLRQEDIRLNLDENREGSWQNNLATAASLVKRGYSRGINVSFGGYVGFIPDTHWHNDHVQTYYQGVFLDGVRRFINYLTWNRDEDGNPLIDSTLVIVSSDIVRGPRYFNNGVQGTSDHRNNSMILIGGGLNHKTQDGDRVLPGRVIGKSYHSLDAASLDFKSGLTAINTENSQPGFSKVRFADIYNSLLKLYDMDHSRYFEGAGSIDIIAKNLRGQYDDS